MDKDKSVQSNEEKSHSAEVSMESKMLAQRTELDSIISVK